jgi:cold shock CspA family protein
MRMKGKLIKWNDDKAFGFIAPNGGGDHVFIHKTALSNRKRIPKINDVITFTISKDKQGRYPSLSD